MVYILDSRVFNQLPLAIINHMTALIGNFGVKNNFHDCGFSRFSIDEKPNDGSPNFAREIAFEKIKNRVEGTKMAAEKLGVARGRRYL